MGTAQSKINDSRNTSSSAAAPAANTESTGVWQKYMQREPGIVLASDDGFFGPDKKHIITYDASEMRTCCSPFLSPDLTVFNSVFKWLKHIRIVSLAIILTLVLGYNDNIFSDTSMGSTAACTEDDPARNRLICQLETVLEEATESFQWLIAFILSGYVAASVATWGRRRTNYASLCGNARNLNILLSSLIPLDKSNKYLTDSRTTLGRWVMLAFELSMLKARGKMDSEAGKEYLLSSGLMVKGEWEAMVNGDRHSTVFWWIAMKIQKLQSEGYLCVEYIVRLTASISSMRGQANDLMSSLDRDRPFPYVAICGFLVNCNLLLMSSWKAVQWSIWLRTFGGDLLFRSAKMWVDILTLFAWNISYASLYDLGYVLNNPFLDKRIDVAHETIFNGVRRLSSALAEGESRLPPDLKQKKMV